MGKAQLKYGGVGNDEDKVNRCRKLVISLSACKQAGRHIFQFEMALVDSGHESFCSLTEKTSKWRPGMLNTLGRQGAAQSITMPPRVRSFLRQFHQFHPSHGNNLTRPPTWPSLSVSFSSPPFLSAFRARSYASLHLSLPLRPLPLCLLTKAIRHSLYLNN